MRNKFLALLLSPPPPWSPQCQMALRYRLLLLDHDDTTVDSTASIHYPAHVESVRALRPDLEPCSLREWFEVVPAPCQPRCRRWRR